MKKALVLCFVGVLAVASFGSVFAKAHHKDCKGHNHAELVVHVASHGAHCRGTVGCSCPGFSPIMNGSVWQQAYCRHCGHARQFH